MNAQTTTLITRPYQEIVDDILTAIVGGVVREPIFYDVKEDHFKLAQQAQAVRSIAGTAGGAHHAFLNGIDFTLSPADNAVAWLAKGTKPDDETPFYVDYIPVGSLSLLTDINVGSVTRTLTEAVSREVAMVYQQVNLAYQAGFVDTAKGLALELVVAILGISRKTKDFAAGLVTFFRDPGAPDGSITIAQGTVLVTADGKATFETTDLRTLQRGQVRIDVLVRATDASRGPVGAVAAGAITTLAQTISGIAKVTNLDPTTLGAADETDDQLRARAKAVLRAIGRATLAGLQAVIREEEAKVDEVWDPNGPAGKTSAPGAVTFLVETEVRRFPSLRGAVDAVRAAGVLTSLLTKYVYVKPRVVVTIGVPVTGAGKLKVVGQVIDAVRAYVDGLSAGTPAVGTDVAKAIKAVKDVTEVRFMDVMAWRTALTQAADAAIIDELVDAVTSSPVGDLAALRTALSTALANAPAIATGRIADRSLVQGPSGKPASDDEIEKGLFTVVPMVGGEKWSVALDMEPADVALAGP
jgi:hypothetical protein